MATSSTSCFSPSPPPLPLPLPLHLPSHRDTYWILEGLLLCQMNDTARGMIENLAYLVDRSVC